ncbi:hypothetical protein QUB28_19820 [Microcoleus sp. B4-C3]
MSALLSELRERQEKEFSFFRVLDVQVEGSRVFLRKYFCCDRQKW